MTGDMVAWLRTIIEGDLAKARDVLQPGDQWYTTQNLFDEAPCVDWDEGEFLTLYTPGTVIARCEAERAILDEHKHAVTVDGLECLCCHVHYGSNGSVHTGAGYCRTVRLLASGYRHREGYREEWAP